MNTTPRDFVKAGDWAIVHSDDDRVVRWYDTQQEADEAVRNFSWRYSVRDFTTGQAALRQGGE